MYSENMPNIQGIDKLFPIKNHLKILKIKEINQWKYNIGTSVS